MKTMLDILQARLQEGPDAADLNGLEIASVKETPKEYRITFCMDGVEQIGYLVKTCAPGQAVLVSDHAIYAALLGICLQRHDLDAARRWKDKLYG